VLRARECAPISSFVVFTFGLAVESIKEFGVLSRHPIDVTGVHFLCHVHGNEHMGTHDAIRNTFVTIAQDVGFHVG
jgi:hypothetical protein